MRQQNIHPEIRGSLLVIVTSLLFLFLFQGSSAHSRSSHRITSPETVQVKSEGIRAQGNCASFQDIKVQLPARDIHVLIVFIARHHDNISKIACHTLILKYLPVKRNFFKIFYWFFERSSDY